jgi:DnaK suppressor protein
MSLSPQSARHYEDKLLEQKKLLEHAMLTAVEQGREVNTDDTQDVADQAVLSYQKELLFSQGTTGHRQLMLVQRALIRMREGSYGDCIQCGTEIREKRLEALPWTPHCIDCQEKIENGQIEDPSRAA